MVVGRIRVIESLRIMMFSWWSKGSLKMGNLKKAHRAYFFKPMVGLCDGWAEGRRL